ncbi:MAG: LmeA family phospholipid-binding protein [Tetrasphaera sp.]|nr:LmeA family phospholipid-binding protein [Tetrasphaera sp.]
MRNFLLGVLSGVLATALAATALVLSVRGEVSPSSAPTPTASPVPSGRPTDFAADDTWLGVVDLNSSEIVTSGGGFIDVSAKGRGIRVSDRGIHAQHLDLEATLPWAVAATQVGEGVELYAAGSGRAGISRTIEVLGQRVPVKATGTVRADNGELVIEPESVDLDGPDWLDTVASAAARALVTIRQPVQGVPDGLRLTGVSVIDTGFRATLSGDGVTITN